MRAKSIEMAETIWNLEGDEEAWHQRIATRLLEMTDGAVASIAYNVHPLPEGKFTYSGLGVPQSPVREGIIAGMDELFRQETPTRELIFDMLAIMRTKGPRVLFSELTLSAEAMEASLLGTTEAGAKDAIFIHGRHVDSPVGTLASVTRMTTKPLSSLKRRQFIMLGAHLAAAGRLRRSLTHTPPEAILDASGRAVHAEGQAVKVEAREALRHAVRKIDRARSSKGGEDALASWTALFDGRWSLVDRFDSDGRRYIVAHKNPDRVKDPRGLSPMQARAAAHAAVGHSDKLTAYHLGVSPATIAGHVRTAMGKLGVATRPELGSWFGEGFKVTEEPPDDL